MADRQINFKIKVSPDGANAKATGELGKFAKLWEQVFGPKGDKAAKTQTVTVHKFADEITRARSELGKLVDDPKGYKELLKLQKQITKEQEKLSKPGGLKGLGDSIDGVVKKAFSLKAALAGTAVGGAAIWGVSKLFEEGQQQVNTRNRIRREFGSEAEGIMSLGDRIGLKSGVQGDEAAKGLIPLAEQLQAIQAGAQFRGMRKPLTAAEADALRKKNLTFGGDIFKRVQTLSPDMDPGELGRVLGDALAGPEGIRSMIATLGLSKRSRTLSQANEKGEAYKSLTPEERKRLGITKKGQYLEQGDLVNLLLQRSGMTDQAAEDERKKFGFQIKSIKSQATDVLGDLGAQALDSLNDKLGKGKTLSEKLHDYLASDDGKKNIQAMADGIATFAKGVITVATELPKVGTFLSEHKSTIMAIAAAYGAIKVGGVAQQGIGMARGLLGAAPAAGGAAGALGSIVPVIAAGALGGALGVYLDEKYKLSDKLGKGMFDLSMEGQFENKANKEFDDKYGGSGHKLKAQTPGQLVAQFNSLMQNPPLTRTVEPYKGDATAALVKATTNGSDVNVTTNLVVDGQVVAKVVTKHMARDIVNQTARGAAPATRE